MIFYYLSQILQPWILPPGLNLIAAIAGHIISRFSKRIGNSLIWLAFISFWLLCAPVIAQFLINTLQDQYPRLILSDLKNKTSSTIIVLGGGSWFDKSAKHGYILSPSTKHRLAYAAYLYRHTHLPILISGGKPEKKAMRDYFNAPVVWEENKSRNTRDEGHYTLPILKKNHIQIVYLVTNAWHMPRAMYSFQQAYQNTKIKIIAAPMGYTALQPQSGIINYLPSLDGLRVSQIAMHEYVGMVAYYVSNFI